MAKKGKDKKGEGDEEKKIKEYLLLEIEKLENLIYFEQEKETSSLKELDNIIDKQKGEFNDIKKTQEVESKKISMDTDNMKNLIDNFTNQVNNLEREITEYEEEIKVKRVEIADLEKKFKEELQKKDEAINEQKSVLDQMSIRFQHILQKTANKLQDRVDMGK